MAASHGCVLASIPITRITKMPQAVLNKEYKMKVPYKLRQGQSRILHELPSGLNMEVIYHKGLEDDKREKSWNPPPLVFVHGSFHAAWCWAEHWLPFFSQNGFDSYALSLLGQVQFSLYICIILVLCVSEIKCIISLLGFQFLVPQFLCIYVKFEGHLARIITNQNCYEIYFIFQGKVMPRSMYVTRTTSRTNLVLKW